MPLPQHLLDFLGVGQQEQQPDMAQQILSARFEPTAQDVGNAALAGVSGNKYVNPQSYSDERMGMAFKQMETMAQLERQQQMMQYQMQSADRADRQLEEVMRHNLVLENKAGQITPYQREYLDIQRQRNNLAAKENGGGGKPPSGYRWLPDGSLEPIPGGPGTTISAELSARLGLANKTLKELPELKESVKAGAATGPLDFATGSMGYGHAGEIARRIEDGADAIQRMLTGAGMPASEAANYTRRFKINSTDTSDILLDKLNNMEAVLTEQIAMATRGRGGAPTVAQPVNLIPQAGAIAPPTPEEEAEYLRLRGGR